MHHLKQQDPDQTVIGDDSHQVVDRRDERSRSHRRIHLDLVEKHRHHRTNECRDHHRNQKRDTNAAGDGERIGPGHFLGEADIKPHKGKGHKAKQQAVAKSDPDLLPHKAHLLAGRKIFIHQHTNGHSQGLRPAVSGHIEDQRLERNHPPSNILITVETAIPKQSRITSQGILFFMLSGRVSFRSDSEIIPANFA